MTVARSLVPAALVALALASMPAHAQAPAAQDGGEPPCFKEFTALRDATATRAKAIQQASERKAPPQEACKLFNSMVAAEAKFVKYVADQGPWCGIPAEVSKQLDENHKKTLQIRAQVCKVAAQGGPAGPPKPSLSQALGAPVTGSNNVRTGRGTFDTLTGTPLGRTTQ